MEYFKNFSLLEYNTFHINVQASSFFRFQTVKELQEWLSEKREKDLLVIGGGSNLLFTRDYRGSILYPDFKGMDILYEEGDEVLVRFAAGEEWDSCVQWAVDQGLGGIENLSYIPGRAGAAPVQNIGAYGVELADLMEYTEGVWLDNGEAFRRYRSECDFDYRYSVFKGPSRNKIVITSVVLRLSRKPRFKLDYGSVKCAVEDLGGINLKNVRAAIIGIRRDKLPDPEIKGNAGSFFKNPVVDFCIFEELKEEWRDIPGYELPGKQMVKIPAGWLIEKCGWKGMTLGRAAVHDKQALVLVNNGGATGREIADLARTIQADVLEKFGINLEPEVNIL